MGVWDKAIICGYVLCNGVVFTAAFTLDVSHRRECPRACEDIVSLVLFRNASKSRIVIHGHIPDDDKRVSHYLLESTGWKRMVLPKLTFNEVGNQEHISTHVIILTLAPAPDPLTPPAAPELLPPRRPPPAVSPQPPLTHCCSPSLAHIAVTSPA